MAEFARRQKVGEGLVRQRAQWLAEEGKDVRAGLEQAARNQEAQDDQGRKEAADLEARIGSVIVKDGKVYRRTRATDGSGTAARDTTMDAYVGDVGSPAAENAIKKAKQDGKAVELAAAKAGAAPAARTAEQRMADGRRVANENNNSFDGLAAMHGDGLDPDDDVIAVIRQAAQGFEDGEKQKLDAFLTQHTAKRKNGTYIKDGRAFFDLLPEQFGQASWLLKDVLNAEQAPADVSKNTPKIDTSAGPVQETPKTEQVKKAPFAKKEDLDHLFGIDAKRQKAIERVDKGTAYFGTQEKADDFIQKGAIKDTHEVVQTKTGRFEVKAKAAPAPVPGGEVNRKPDLRNSPSSANSPLPPPAPRSNGTPSVQSRWDVFMPAERIQMLAEAGYTDNDQARVLSGTKWTELSEAVRKAVDAVHKQQVAAATPATESAIDRRKRLIAEREGEKLAPGTRINGEAERKAADRLQQLHEQMDGIMDRNSREGSAKMAVRSVIEELRKARTVTSIVPLLDGAANGLDRKYGALANVIREVAESLNGSTKPAEQQMSAPQAQDGNELASRWPRMTTVERAGLATRAGMNDVAVGRVSNTEWAKLDRVVQDRLEKTEAKKPVPQVPNEPGTKYVLPTFATNGATKPAGKAEMRPYRREDGSVGYEAVPIEDKAPAAEPPTEKPGVVKVPADVAAAIEGQLKKQKARVSRLTSEAQRAGMTLDEKTAAQTKVKAAETTLRKMRTSIFDAEDAALKALASGNAADFAEHADLFSDAADVIQAQAKPAAPAAAPAKPDALSEREKAAKAKMMAAAAKLADLLGKNTRLNITPEQEQKLLPIVIELFDGAMELGFVKFKQAARYVRDFIAQAIDQDAADSIPIDTLQGAYIATARRHTDKDITPKAEVVAVDSVAELDEPADQADTTQEPTRADNATPLQPQDVPAGDSRADEANDAPGAGDRQSVGAGLAAGDTGPVQSGQVSGSLESAGGTGARDPEPAGQQPSRPARDRAGVRPESEPADFVIDADEIGKGGLTKKYRDNVAAIRVLKAIEAEGRPATPEERKVLSKYAGWGAMKGPFDPANKQWAKQHAELNELLTPDEFRAARKSTLDAHYTSSVAVGAMNDALERLGYKGGRMLEPSVGVGNFYGLMPAAVRKASQLYGVELDSLTSRMVAALYPKAKIAKAIGFEDFDIPAEFFDLVQGNPPFGRQPLVDAQRSAYSGFSIHNYFLSKGIDKLRPGGLMEVVVSHNFLDAIDARARQWIGDRANLIGAVRLPDTAFKENAGTDVVTDILIFQKKTESERANGLGADVAPWQKVVDQVNINPKTGESVTHRVNELFVNNPQWVLGTPSAGGSQYAANQYTVEATGDIKAQLADWVKTLPENIYQPIKRGPEVEVDMAVPDGVKVGSFYVDPTGEIRQRGEDVMGNKTAKAWTPANAKAAERMKGMIALRETLRNQMRLERSLDASTADIEANRATLNKLYDDFLKKHGHLNNQVNRRLFLDDTEAQLLQALEFDFDKGVSKAVAENEGIDPREPTAIKADIFARRVAFPPQDYLTVTTAKDALLASLNYRGKVDGAYMSEVYGKPADKIIEELGEVVFDDPQQGIVTADEYLSGDVKTKLAEAKAAGTQYRRNVQALEKVIPVDKKPSEINVSIGAAFVPAGVYEQFVKHITGGNSTAAYIKATGQWLMSFSGGADAALNTGKFGTDHLSAQELFQMTMMGRGAVVKKTTRNADGTTTTVLMEKETEAAREKQNAIKAEWQTWLWGEPTRADAIANLYNDKLNRIVERKYDGSHLSFPGMNPGISLLEHQKNGVWRGLQSYQVLYDHVVGAGKTFEMATLAMEMRRLGISRKPLFIVPNHLTLQWRSEFTRLYPGSNILAATPEDFSAVNRERLFSKIITGDWDAVVIGHSSLKKIGLPEATEKAVLQEQIDEVVEAIESMKRGRGDRNIIRDMEGIRSRLEAKMKEKLAAIGNRSKVVTFDELGIDAMFIDEMHEFKNLTYNSTMDRNPGMGNPAGSGKAFDLFVKTRWMFDTFGEKTPYITATGTPVSNSLVEMYNMQRYMQYPTLKAQGLHVFDAWAKQFGSVENVYEVAPSGSGYRQSTRFAKFTNLPGLMGLYNSFADTITLDDLKAQEEAQGKRFPVPKMVGGKPQIVVAQRSPAVANLMGVPEANTDEDGNIKFMVDLSKPVLIGQNKETGKWIAKVGDTHLGEFPTEEDARIKVVERAVTPDVTVEPASILGRFANLRQLTKESKGKVNALSLTGEANKAGLDYRLINPSAPDFPGSKINLAVDNMVRIYQQWAADKGAQLVFCDMSIPLSARASYSTTARRLYVRDDAGALAMKRGTMHTLEGQESLPYFVVQRGEKDLKRFDVYDAATGLKLLGDLRTKQDALDSTNGILADENKRQRLIEAREVRGEISQEAIDEYNNENDIEADGVESFTREDIAGVSGAAKFSVYDDIKAKLIAKGIPEREIAFIHDYSTPTAKDKLFKAVNAGDIRFLLGSTPKMGAGTNVQKRLVGLHHIDAPWRPSDLEQREGRIIRRGNDLYARDPDGFEVFIGRYATEQTYDTRRWQILEHKARGIEQLRNFDGTINEIDDIEGEAANSADMKAAASGDPLILEETRLRNDVRRLEQLQAAHADDVLAMNRKARSSDNYAATEGPKQLAEIGALRDAAKKHPLDKDGWAPITVNDKKHDTKEAAQAALARDVNEVRASLKDEATIIYRGVEFTVFRQGSVVTAESPTGNIGVWAAADPFSTSGFVQRLKNYVDRLDAIIDDIKASMARAVKDADALRAQAATPFGQAQALVDAREAYKKVQRALLAKGPAVPDSQKPAVAAATKAQKARLEELGFGEQLREFFAGKDEAGEAQPAGSTNMRQTGAPEGNEADVVFSRGQRAAGIPPRAAQEIANAIAARWANAPDVVVVANMQDAAIPARVRQEDKKQRSQGASGEPEGFFYGGKVYVVASALNKPADVVRVLFHEALGHAGLRGVFGEGLAPILKQLATLRRAEVAAKAKEYGLDMSRESDRLQAAEEVLAVMAQTKPELGYVQRAIAAIRAFLRKNVPGFAGMKLTDDEIIQQFILPARRFVERGPGGGPRGGQPAPAMSRSQTPAFDAWFAGSKVVDEDGRPQVLYHATTGDFAEFKPGGTDPKISGPAIWMTDSKDRQPAMHNTAVRGGGFRDGTNVMPLYASIKRPLLIDDKDTLEWAREVFAGGSKEFPQILLPEWVAEVTRDGEYDGIIFDGPAIGWKDAVREFIVFQPDQVKSAIGNAGTFDPANPDIRFSRSTVQQTIMDAVPQGVIDRLSDISTSQRGMNRWWHRTVGTQLHKAKTNKQFAPVYYAVQDFMKDVSRMATLAADHAPDLLPQVDTLTDVKKLLPQMGLAGGRQRKADLKQASDALFDGTLRYTRNEDGAAVPAQEDDAKGVVWTNAELRARGMSPQAIKLYRQAREAIEQSLDNLLAADVYRMSTALQPEYLAENPADHGRLMERARKAAASGKPLDAVTMVRQALTQRADQTQQAIRLLRRGQNDGRMTEIVLQELKDLTTTFNGIQEALDKVDDKTDRVDALKDAGYAPLMRFGQYTVDALDAAGNRVHFGMYESQMASNEAARGFRAQGLIVSQAIQSQKDFELLKGVSPETAMLFADMMGLEKNEAMQAWLQKAVAQQSALKRHIRRKGVEGFNEDASRVVAAFITSNSRAASRALHGLRIQTLVENVRDGDVKDEAIALTQYVENPKEEAQALRGLLFVNYIGGSVASALVNLTQTLVQTFPYLSQYGGPLKAGKHLGAAMQAVAGKITDPALADAVKRAEADGVIKPQEVFQLQAEASRTMGSDLRVRAGLALWGSFFQAAETFNRRVAFIAAYQTAKEQGIKDPFAFAEGAVEETQGVFNKGNRPNWSRGAIGATLFTFKTFTIQYVEFLKRLPAKERALALAVLVLLSGIRGIPFAADAEDLLDTVAQALGYNFTTKEQMDRFLVATLGDGFADFLQHGASTIPGMPFDVSARLGMADLLPGTGLLKKSETSKENQVLEAFGVAGSFVRDGLKGEFKPIAIRNLAKGIEMYDRGIYTDSRGRTVMEVDGVDAAVKSIGLQPSNVASESRAVRMQFEKRALFSKVKGEISEAMALAQFENDPAKVKDARAKLEAWNEKNPEARIVLNSQAIRRRVVEMRRDRSERFIRSTPKELRTGTREALQ